MTEQGQPQGARLAIADPPYPPIRAVHPRNDSSRARRWYDKDYRKSGDARFASDHHADAGEWDQPERHRALMDQLESEYDGWAIATAHDGVPVYGWMVTCSCGFERQCGRRPSADRVAADHVKTHGKGER